MLFLLIHDLSSSRKTRLNIVKNLCPAIHFNLLLLTFAELWRRKMLNLHNANICIPQALSSQASDEYYQILKPQTMILQRWRGMNFCV